MAVPTFHALYAAGFFGAASPSSSPLPWPSSRPPGLGSQLAPCGVGNFGAAGFASCCGPLACTFPIRKARPRASTPRSPRTSAGCYEGALVPPSAGLPPASHRELPGCTRAQPSGAQRRAKASNSIKGAHARRQARSAVPKQRTAPQGAQPRRQLPKGQAKEGRGAAKGTRRLA